MKEIFEQYGFGILYLLAGILTVGVVVACIKSGGILNTIVAEYMQSICG